MIQQPDTLKGQLRIYLPIRNFEII